MLSTGTVVIWHVLPSGFRLSASRSAGRLIELNANTKLEMAALQSREAQQRNKLLDSHEKDLLVVQHQQEEKESWVSPLSD